MPVTLYPYQCIIDILFITNQIAVYVKPGAGIIIIIYYEKSYIIIHRTYKANKITYAALISQMCAKWVPLT